MTLRIVDHAGLSDVGRQREANEDNYVLAAPVFAVADGMGGAQAGEVASQIAAAAFESADAEHGTPEQRLTRLTADANRRIYELAQSDRSRRGMGTTLTAAFVSTDGVSLAHVGDSRAYRLRDGSLEQLTDDHSLVAELQRSGQLTAEAAESHPQRSIITRALGPEAEVEIDAHTHRARSGDVYLLCSDGLTGMISDTEVEQILRDAPSLDAAANALIRAANQQGGRDNITVVLFRLEDDGAGAAEATLAGDETIHRGVTTDDVHAAVADQERAVVAPRAPSRVAQAGSAAPTTPRRARARRAVGALAGVVVVAAVGVAAWLGARQVHFVATNDGGFVTLYRGLPYDLPFGLSLYSPIYASSVPARTIARARRDRVLDHEWRSDDDARDLVRQLEQGRLDIGGGG